MPLSGAKYSDKSRQMPFSSRLPSLLRFVVLKKAFCGASSSRPPSPFRARAVGFSAFFAISA